MAKHPGASPGLENWIVRPSLSIELPQGLVGPDLKDRVAHEQEQKQGLRDQQGEITPPRKVPSETSRSQQVVREPSKEEEGHADSESGSPASIEAIRLERIERRNSGGEPEQAGERQQRASVEHEAERLREARYQCGNRLHKHSIRGRRAPDLPSPSRRLLDAAGESLSG